MKTRYIAIALALFTSCQKEITLPYRSVDPIAVIEGSVCQDSAVVKLGTSVDMEAPLSSSNGFSGAAVSLSYDGNVLKMKEMSPGVYKPEEEFHGEPGKEYSLSVSYGGNTYTSSSSMPQQVQVLKSGFSTIDLVGYKSWLYQAIIQDTPGEDNYYAYYFYEDGVLFYWDMTYDMGCDGQPISIDVPIESDEEALYGTDEHHTLPEGGTAVLEIRSIDKKTFDYYYSLAVTSLSYCNALQNFEVKSTRGEAPACLGYFGAYSSVKITEVFHREPTFPEE